MLGGLRETALLLMALLWAWPAPAGVAVHEGQLAGSITQFPYPVILLTPTEVELPATTLHLTGTWDQQLLQLLESTPGLGHELHPEGVILYYGEEWLTVLETELPPLDDPTEASLSDLFKLRLSSVVIGDRQTEWNAGTSSPVFGGRSAPFAYDGGSGKSVRKFLLDALAWENCYALTVGYSIQNDNSVTAFISYPRGFVMQESQDEFSLTADRLSYLLGTAETYETEVDLAAALLSRVEGLSYTDAYDLLRHVAEAGYYTTTLTNIMREITDSPDLSVLLLAADIRSKHTGERQLDRKAGDLLAEEMNKIGPESLDHEVLLMGFQALALADPLRAQEEFPHLVEWIRGRALSNADVDRLVEAAHLTFAESGRASGRKSGVPFKAQTQVVGMDGSASLDARKTAVLDAIEAALARAEAPPLAAPGKP